jgi:hypothetical protein
MSHLTFSSGGRRIRCQERWKEEGWQVIYKIKPSVFYDKNSLKKMSLLLKYRDVIINNNII